VLLNFLKLTLLRTQRFRFLRGPSYQRLGIRESKQFGARKLKRLHWSGRFSQGLLLIDATDLVKRWLRLRADVASFFEQLVQFVRFSLLSHFLFSFVLDFEEFLFFS
jgi:hypothetical protein